MIEIHKGDRQQITPSFRISEFFTKAPGVEVHDLDERLITAAQIIRDFYGVPCVITSSYRPSWYNSSIGGVPGSQHIRKRAIDITIKDTHAQADYGNQIATHGDLYQQLISVGIRGFGLYDTFLHIDTRESSAMWDNRKKKIIYIDSEDGIVITTGGRWLFLSIAAVVIALIIYLNFKP